MSINKQNLIYLLLSSLLLLSAGCKKQKDSHDLPHSLKNIDELHNTSEQSIDKFVLETIENEDIIIFVNPQYMLGKNIPAEDIQYVVLRKDGGGDIAQAGNTYVSHERKYPHLETSIEEFSWEERDGRLYSTGIPLKIFRNKGTYWLAITHHIPNVMNEPGCCYFSAECFRVSLDNPNCMPLIMIEPRVLDYIESLGSVINWHRAQLRSAHPAEATYSE